MAVDCDIIDVLEVSKKDFKGCDFSFEVTCRISPPLDESLDHVLHVENVQSPYRKQYDTDSNTLVTDAGPDHVEIEGTETENGLGVADQREEIEELEEEFDSTNQLFAVARSNSGEIRGYIHVREMWNKMASLEDIAVDRLVRGHGIAKALIDRALEWTKQEELRALRAETQDNNVSACHLYRTCGFQFGGYDSYLYATNENLRHEKALFWYRFLDT